MINKLKKIKFTKRGVYISLAICMLMLGGIGIFSAVRNMGKIIDESDFEYNDIPTGSQLITPFLDDKATNSQAEDDANTNITLNFRVPSEGQVVKEHSGLELVFSNTMNDYRTHSGVDILTSDSASVVSTESGKIINVYNDPLWGTTIEIEHEGGFTSCYRNLSETLPEGIEAGSYVAAGGIIGKVGTTALVEIGEEAHLHFEMCLNGNKIDPREYINFN